MTIFLYIYFVYILKNWSKARVWSAGASWAGTAELTAGRARKTRRDLEAIGEQDRERQHGCALLKGNRNTRNVSWRSRRDG